MYQCVPTEGLVLECSYKLPFSAVQFPHLAPIEDLTHMVLWSNYVWDMQGLLSPELAWHPERCAVLAGQHDDRSCLPPSCPQATEHPELLEWHLRCALEGQPVDRLHGYMRKLWLPVPASGLRARSHQQACAGTSLLLEATASKLAALQHHTLWKRYFTERRGSSAAAGGGIRQSHLSEM